MILAEFVFKIKMAYNELKCLFLGHKYILWREKGFNNTYILCQKCFAIKKRINSKRRFIEENQGKEES